MSEGRHNVRVYYEDTDCGGVVYHATYVCFFERARTEWLRQFGINQRDYATSPGVLFAVKTLAIDYKKPALLDDWLTITTRAAAAGRSRVQCSQQLLRDDTLLATAEVEIVCVSGTPFRPCPIPAEILQHLTR